MSGTLRIEGANTLTFNFTNGVPYTETLNTELESCVVIVPNVSSIYDFQPLDKAIITENMGTKSKVLRLVIDNVSIVQKTFNESANLYDYTFNLISPLKELQGIILPNKSLTQIIGRIKTCYDAFSKLLSLYAPNYSISASLITLLTSKPYPEMQWNRPTLFEALNSLLAIFGCCLSLNSYNILDYKDLSAKSGVAINESLINGYEANMSASNYASCLDAEITNGISNNYTIETPIISPRSTDGVLTTENATLILEKPIYEIKKLQVVSQVKLYIEKIDGSEETFDFDGIDLTSKVVESTLYGLKSTTAIDSSYLPLRDLKRNFIYFQRGNNKIEGLGYTEGKLFNIQTNTAISSAIVSACCNKAIEQGLLTRADVEEREKLKIAIGDDTYISIINEGAKIRKILFKVEYTTQDELRTKAFKTNAPRNNYTQIDNQKDAFVDVDNFGANEEKVVNSMANCESVKTGVCYSLTDIEALGNYYLRAGRKQILYKREYQIYDDYILTKYYFSEDYANQNLSSLLSQVKRYTQIASANESLLRCETYNKKFKWATSGVVYNGIVPYMLKIKQPDYRNKHITRSKFSNNNYSHYYILISQNIKIGKSILSSMKYMDNYAVGYAITDTSATGGYAEKQVSYTDDYGETSNIIINFGAYNDANYQYEEDIDAYDISKSYPETYNDTPELTDTLEQYNLLVYKDNREQMQLGFQFSFINTNNGYFYDAFVELNPLLNKTNANQRTFKIYETTSSYNGLESDVLGNENTSASFTIDNNKLTISGLSTGKTGVAICYGSSNKLVVAFNKLSSSTTITRYLIKEGD